MKKYEKNLEILNYISLISQIIIVLVDIESGRNNFFTKSNRNYFIKEGKRIIDEMLSGSNFIEKKVFKRGYSPQSIIMFDYGIKSLENEAKIDKGIESYTSIFSILSEKMSDVCSGKSNPNDINYLINFFKSLNEILDSSYNKQRPVPVGDTKLDIKKFDLAYN